MGKLIITRDDAKSRNKIVNEIDKSFFVEAGAGSGKTTMLVSRMVALIEAGKEIDKICAITFTKAAAAEFYKRFQELLSERSEVRKDFKLKGYAGELPAPTETTAKRCAKALENINLCFMGTIDSFCQMILAEHPMNAGIPSDASITDEEELKKYFEDEYYAMRRGDRGEELKFKSNLFSNFYDDDVETFIYGVNYVMGRRNITFHYPEIDSDKLNINTYYEDKKNKLIDTLNAITNAALEFRNFKTNVIEDEKWENINYYLNVLNSDWEKNFKKVFTVISSISHTRSGLRASSGIDGKSNIDMSFFDALISRYGRVYGYRFNQTLKNELDEIRYYVTMQLIIASVNSVEKKLKTLGKLSYFDYLYFLRNMLDKDAEEGGKLTKYIYRRHKYFFVDEFQDTNPMQAEVFFHITAKESKIKWTECIPEEGSLFIVGDPKQSIYRFRSADVDAYKKVKNLFNENVGEILYLTKNFRSRYYIKEFFNEAFTQMMPINNTKGQCEFEKIDLSYHPAEDATLFEGIYKYDAYTGSYVNDYPSLTDPIMVAEIIKRLVNNPEYKIETPDEKEAHPIRYKDIRVVSYAKENLADILNELNKNNIPYKSEGKVLFYRCPGLKALYFLLNAIALPYDAAALMKVLRTEVMGFTFDELVSFSDKYCADGRISYLKEIDIDEEDELAVRINEKLLMLKRIYEKTRILTPAGVCMAILEDVEFFNCISSKNLEILYYALEVIKSEQGNGKIVTLKDCADFIYTLLSDKTEYERCLSLSVKDDKVNVANLHKVKGLEAPIVILTYWFPPFAFTPGTYITYENDKPQGYLINCYESTGKEPKIYFRTSSFPEEEKKEIEALKLENERLVYVAATRARNALIMCNSFSKASTAVDGVASMWKNYLYGIPLSEKFVIKDIFKDTKENTKENTIENTYTSDDEDEKNIYNSEDLYKKAKDESVLNNRDIEEKSYEIITPSRVKMNQLYSEDSVNDTVDSIEEELNEYITNESEKVLSEEDSATLHRKARILGSAVHKLMECIVVAKGKIDIEITSNEIANTFVGDEFKEYRDILKTALVGVADKILNGGYIQINGAPNDIFKELLESDEVHCEVPFAYRDGDSVWNGIVDMMYLKNGKWHIIDYKTNAEEEGLVDEYKGQLTSYIKAFKEISGEDADAFIYHIDI